MRGLGSAKTGTEHWWVQRMTALAGIPLMIFLVVFIIAHSEPRAPRWSRACRTRSWRLRWRSPSSPSSGTCGSGLQVVIEDYIHSPTNKFLALLFNTAFTVIMGAAALYAILKMSFGL